LQGLFQMPRCFHAPTLLSRALLGVAAATTATLCLATGAAQADTPGDPHSPAVVANAAAALAAEDALTAGVTADTLAAYVTARDATADAVAAEMAIDPAAVRDAWARADMPHQTAVLAALAELGKPYRYATSDPDVGFDCSGLTAYAWERAGVGLAHQSSAQIRAAASRDRSTAMAGDIVQYPGHVMLYLGVDDAIVHAANRQDDVELDFVHRRVRFGNPIG
jgi:cell wall-associated NlpC family hydrolase